MRRVPVLLALVSSLALAGCVGDSDLATHIRTGQAQLNGYGYTNNGPAKWWWEYGTSKAKVAGGHGVKTAVAGPASSADYVEVSATVPGLDSDQFYYFRACGQDTAAGSSATCGRVLRFRTAGAVDEAKPVSAAGGQPAYESLVAPPQARHNLTVTAAYSTSDPFTTYFTVADPVDPSVSDPPTGASLKTNASCSLLAHDPDHFPFDPYDDQAICSATRDQVLRTTLSPFDDTFTLTGDAAPVEVHGGAGSDVLTGGGGDDKLYGEAGYDHLVGGAGNDVLDGGPDSDTFVCGPGTDTAIVSNDTEYIELPADCENFGVGPDATPKFRAWLAQKAAERHRR